MSNAAVKSEPLDQWLEDDGGGMMMDEADPSSSSTHPPRPTIAPVEDEDDDPDDPIVREIGVCISPDLARTISLVQFPLRPAAPPPPPSGGRHGGGQSAARPPSHPLPESARIKSRHGILELDYAPPRSTIEAASSLRSLPDALAGTLRRRTYRSHPVPIRTHMALGKMSGDGTRLDVVPLGRVLQMRPDFTHLDEDDEMGPDEPLGGAAAAKKKTEKPLMYKRPESERSLALKRSSYAFKKAAEDAEEWTDLDVCGPRSDEKVEYKRRVACPNPGRRLELAASANDTSADEAYVRSLNYLTEVVGVEEEEEEEEGDADMDGAEGDGKGGAGDAASAAAALSSRRLKDLTVRVAALLHRGGGCVPVPFPVLRSSFSPREASDAALAAAASACAVLVRGNFVLRSDLLGLSDVDADARDVVLLLLDRHGRVRREALVRTFEELTSSATMGGESGGGDDDEGMDVDGGGPSSSSTSSSAAVVDVEVVNALLEGVTEPGRNSVELRAEDDAGFAARFPGVAELHRRYWERRMGSRLGKFVERYEELADPSARVGE